MAFFVRAGGSEMLNIAHKVENRKSGLGLEFHYGAIFLARVGQLGYH